MTRTKKNLEAAEHGSGGRGRFLQVSDRLLDADLSPSEFRVAVVLARRLRDQASPTVSYGDLATVAHVSRDTVVSAVRGLAAKGIVEVEERRREDGGCAKGSITIAAAWAVPGATPSEKTCGGLAGTEAKEDATPSEKTCGVPSEKVGEAPPEKVGGKELQRERDSVQDQNSLVGDASPSPTTRKRAPKKARTYTPDSVEYQLAARLRSAILHNFPGAKVPAEDNLDRWADNVRLLQEDPEREIRPTPEQIAATIDWCQADSWWQDVIQSTKNLRKHFDHLARKAAKAQVARVRTTTLRQPVFELGGEAAYDPQLEGSATA